MVRESFESEWSQLARRLRARLERRRVPSWLIDDVVQETGLKLFQMWPEVDAARSPWGLTITIANNLLWDEMNRRRAREVPSDIPERAATNDVEETSLARLELYRIKRYMRQMSESHRTILLAEVGEAPVDTSSSGDALKMRRMRARRRLHSLLQGASAPGVFAGELIRDSLRRVSDFLKRSNDSTATQTASTAASLIAAAVMLGAPPGIFGSAGPAEARPAGDAGLSLKPVGYLGRQVHDARAGGEGAGVARAETMPRAADRSGESPSRATGANLTIGDDDTPARGGAGLRVTPQDDWEPSLPDCEAEPRPNGASASCHAETPAGDVDVGGEVEVDP